MRILFVDSPTSSDPARWINHINDQGWELHFTPTAFYALRPYLTGKITVHFPPRRLVAMCGRILIRVLGQLPGTRSSGHIRRLTERIYRHISQGQLNLLIKHIEPDIVHSLQIQHAHGPTLATKKSMGADFPAWMVSNWSVNGAPEFQSSTLTSEARRVLEECDYYVCGCQTDLEQAEQGGLKGEPLPLLPCIAGFRLEQWYAHRQPGPTSTRRVILLDASHYLTGRTMVGLRAIELCADAIRERGYSVLISPASPELHIPAELITYSAGIPIELVPQGTEVDAMRRMGAARVHLSLNIAQSISYSLLEALVMGAFPIHSHTSSANEWIEDGKSGFIVPPDDPHIVAEALRRAITDDALVDEAVCINDETVRKRLAHDQIKQQVINIYQTVYEQSRRS